MNLKKVVEDAKLHMEAFDDCKAWAGEEEMRALIAAGAKVTRRDYKQISGTYVTEVVYQDICFTHASFRPLFKIRTAIFH